MTLLPNAIVLILIAATPSLLWLWWFWSTAGKKQSLDAMARAFIYGAIAIIPALKLENVGSTFMTHNFMLTNFLVIGPTEELFKFLATAIALRFSSPVKETSNRIVVAAAAALGFAFAENIGFFIWLNPPTLILRMAIIPAHVLFSVPWAVAVGRTKRFTYSGSAVITMGLALSSFLHGSYDALLFSIGSSPFLLLILLSMLMTIMWFIYRKRMGEVHGNIPRIRFSDFKKPLHFDMIGFIFLLGLAVSIFLALISRLGLPWQHNDASNETLGAGIIIGLFFTGFVAPYCAPNNEVSMRESAIGLSLLGVFVGVLIGKEIPIFMKWSFGLAVIGALGGWLGEMLRPNPNSKTRHDEPDI
ncbi:MAG TPA: PrsW family glutamic-type intramembrane protease [Drouetiella sp.]